MHLLTKPKPTQRFRKFRSNCRPCWPHSPKAFLSPTSMKVFSAWMLSHSLIHIQSQSKHISVFLPLVSPQWRANTAKGFNSPFLSWLERCGEKTSRLIEKFTRLRNPRHPIKASHNLQDSKQILSPRHNPTLELSLHSRLFLRCDKAWCEIERSVSALISGFKPEFRRWKELKKLNVFTELWGFFKTCFVIFETRHKKRWLEASHKNKIAFVTMRDYATRLLKLQRDSQEEHLE